MVPKTYRKHLTIKKNQEKIKIRKGKQKRTFQLKSSTNKIV